jgi:hypothetical protein
MTEFEITPLAEVGKIVHFGATTPHGLTAWAAITTKVNEDGSLELLAFLDKPSTEFGSLDLKHVKSFQHVPYSPMLKPEHWSWPPSVMAELMARLRGHRP